MPLPITRYLLPSQEQINKYLTSVNNMTIQPGLTLSEISANVQGNNIFTDIFKQLRSIKTEADILQAGVEIVKQSLNCDRTVVYSLQDNSYCKIVAEAVTPGYTQTLDMTIRDSCFEQGYIEKYRKGRVRAINDVYKSGMNPCHIKNLEKIEVRSNLVVPIVRSDNSLYGLLVMHQCSRARQWQQTEIAFVLEIAAWIVEQLERQQAYCDLQSKLGKIEQAQQLITSIIQEIHGATSAKEVLCLGVRKARETLNCDRVVVYSLQKENLGEIVAEATSSALAPILGKVIKDPCFEYRYSDRYQQGRIRATANIFEAGLSDCYLDTLTEIGVKSNLVAPINWDDGRIYGLLIAHQCFTFKDWQSQEIEHFRQIALHIGLCLSKAKIKEQSLAIETGFNRLEDIKNTVNLAQQKIDRAKQPIYSTNQILIEANNLNKLLEREIDRINQTGLAQTKKDIKLIQIIFRKLVMVLAKVRPSLVSINTSRNEANVTLKNAIALLEKDEINSDRHS